VAFFPQKRSALTTSLTTSRAYSNCESKITARARFVRFASQGGERHFFSRLSLSLSLSLSSERAQKPLCSEVWGYKPLAPWLSSERGGDIFSDQRGQNLVSIPPPQKKNEPELPASKLVGLSPLNTTAFYPPFKASPYQDGTQRCIISRGLQTSLEGFEFPRGIHRSGRSGRFWRRPGMVTPLILVAPVGVAAGSPRDAWVLRGCFRFCVSPVGSLVRFIVFSFVLWAEYEREIEEIFASLAVVSVATIPFRGLSFRSVSFRSLSFRSVS